MTAEKEALMGSQTAKNLQLAVRPKHGSEQTTRQLVAANPIEETSRTSVSSHIRDTTEQEDGAITPILEDTEYTRSNHDDEATSESDVHEAALASVEFDVFDSDAVLEGMRLEKLFGPTDADDVNMMSMADSCDSDSDADDEDVMADN
ncbi:hypothetical protein F441_21521 [Phytophthora nicotianae CJ01A1]|nr:hypothetical protein F444_21668 [Phytophthora nicotianae P1976]ETP01208.1 hypothetical protein F441_21521 [Phytophthora nicotianae CJ01A1]